MSVYDNQTAHLQRVDDSGDVVERDQALIKREERKSPAGAQQGHQHRGHLESPPAQERRRGEI